MGLAPRQRGGQAPGRPLPWASVSISVLPTGAHPAPQAGILTVVPWLPEHLCEQKQRLRRTPPGNVENGGQQAPEPGGYRLARYHPRSRGLGHHPRDHLTALHPEGLPEKGLEFTALRGDLCLCPMRSEILTQGRGLH